MARKLTEKEFITELANRWGVTYDSAKTKYYEFVEFLCDELLMYGFIDLPTFGNFRTETQQGRYIYTPIASKDDTPEKIWIDTHERIKFRASKSLKAYINDDKATKAETMRHRRALKKKEISDKEREHQIEIAENRALAMELVKQKQKERKKAQQNWGKNKKIIEQPIEGYWEDFKE